MSKELDTINKITQKLEKLKPSLKVLKIIAIHKGEELIEWAKTYDKEHDTHFYELFKEVL